MIVLYTVLYPTSVWHCPWTWIWCFHYPNHLTSKQSIYFWLSYLLPFAKVLRKGIPFLFREARINPVSPFTQDRLFITFTSSEEDGMISHDLWNLVLDGLVQQHTPQSQRYPPPYSIFLLFLLYFCGIRWYFLQILIVSAYI